MKNRLWRSIVAATLMVGAIAAHAQSGDERILAAREALRTGDRQTLEALAAFHEPHLLDAYVDYWLLMNVLARIELNPKRRVDRADIELAPLRHLVSPG